MNKYQNAGENCAFLQVNLAEDIPKQGFRKLSETSVRTFATKKSFLKISQKLQECT